MKRSPMPPRTKPLPRSPLRKSGAKRGKGKYPSAAQLRERREWASLHSTCWLCGGNHNLETHEIASRAIAPLKWADVRNYARLCNRCNCGFANVLPEVVQIALKRLHDSEHYDRAFINELRHRATEAVTEAEVSDWCRLLTVDRSQG